MEVMEVHVMELPGTFCQSLHQTQRHAGYAGKVHMVTAPYAFHRLQGRYIIIKHISFTYLLQAGDVGLRCLHYVPGEDGALEVVAHDSIQRFPYILCRGGSYPLTVVDFYSGELIT